MHNYINGRELLTAVLYDSIYGKLLMDSKKTGRELLTAVLYDSIYGKD
jgi:hypothetical protein